MQGDNISTVGDNISNVEGIHYCGGIPSVLWRLFSTVGDNISTVGDRFSTVGDNISTVGVTSVLWRVFSTVGEEF